MVRVRAHGPAYDSPAKRDFVLRPCRENAATLSRKSCATWHTMQKGGAKGGRRDALPNFLFHSSAKLRHFSTDARTLHKLFRSVRSELQMYLTSASTLRLSRSTY